ncbi:MAG TPA: AmmeMemoRadiSam system protein A [Kofleriaceae bacterium]|nr:AmmeMemoRadiSam system protein A [Kofleriaceae bacterium]
MSNGMTLARYAREKLREHLGGPLAVKPSGAWCDVPGATFVTLRWPNGQLQGCIGTLEADRSLVDDVASNAIAAGTRDPRTRPCVLGDVDKLDVELSILSALEPIGGEADIRVGIDGIVMLAQGRRATFLPVMWERLRDIPTFMAELKQKAGLPRTYAGEMQLMRYTVEKHTDPAPR